MRVRVWYGVRGRDQMDFYLAKNLYFVLMKMYRYFIVQLDVKM